MLHWPADLTYGRVDDERTGETIAQVWDDAYGIWYLAFNEKGRAKKSAVMSRIYGHDQAA